MKIRIACCDDEKQQLELYKTMFTNIEMRQDIKLNVEYFLSGNFMLERFQSEKIHLIWCIWIWIWMRKAAWIWQKKSGRIITVTV